MYRRLPIAIFILLSLLVPGGVQAQENPIVFVGQVPQPEDFATIGSTFANHQATVKSVPRGGGLFIRYPDGTIKNLTQAAGFGVSGFQNQNGIAVRDPVVHWSGDKVLFSMVVGSPAQYQHNNYRWQLYEITNLGKAQTPQVTKVPNQPASYNNIMPAYGSNDRIIFVSDLPIGGSHLYPSLDEYESTPTNTGILKLNPQNGSIKRLDHSPSGSFDPFIDRFGRVIFTRWDHLQQDQQADSGNFGSFNYLNESKGSPKLINDKEIFPEPRGSARQIDPTINLHEMNTFFPWMMSQNGTGLETLNHIGRHELLDYFDRKFNNDPDLKEFIAATSGRLNPYSAPNIFHISEDPSSPGSYYGILAPEFETHSSGQIISFYAPPGLAADKIIINSVTHPDTSKASYNPSVNHSGLYRNAIQTTSGELLATHTFETRPDSNEGTVTNPQSRYDFRIRRITKQGSHFKASTPITNGIGVSVSFFNPDQLVNYVGDLWELQPVELVPREVPPLWKPVLPNLEKSIFASEGVDLASFQSAIASNNMALVIVRDVTSRDSADRQQPFNLRVLGSNTSSLATYGKLYDVASLQFVRGAQLRGYTNFVSGRRTIGEFLSGQKNLISPQYGEAEGSARVFADGSVAALVPAQRALSWQLLDPAGKAVVRERYWLTFQPGEVRLCASCHGVNSTDQTGQVGKPTNAPDALKALLGWWKESGGELTPKNYVRAFGRRNVRRGFVEGRLFARRPFRLEVHPPPATDAPVEVKLGLARFSCPQNFGELPPDKVSVVQGRMGPLRTRRARVRIQLVQSGDEIASKVFPVRSPRRLQRRELSQRVIRQRFCRRASRSIRRLNPDLF